MWIIVKIKKNCVIENLKANLKNLFSAEPVLYSPKILQQNIIGNKFKERGT